MNTSKFTFLFLALVFIACQNNEGQEIVIVDKAAIEMAITGKKVQLIDVRTSEEYDAGHIANAVNFNIINRDTFLIQVQELDKQQPVYLYCKMGGRSNRAAQLLKEKGFKKIFDYSGGYNDWVLE